MSHRTNQRPAPCATCKTAIAADAGTLLGPPWKVVCQACLPFPSLAATPIRITRTGDRIHVEAVGRLGNERWGAYKAIIDRHGVRARKVGTIWQNYADVSVAGDLIKALSDAGFALEVADDVRTAVVAAGEVATVDVEAANERLVAVDAELARRGKALYPFQREGVAWLAARGSALLGDDMGCIDGMAVVTIQRAGASRKMTLAKLHHKFNGGWSRGRCWDTGIPAFVKSLCGAELRLHRIERVLDQGVKPVVKLMLASGKSLRMTPDHEVARPDGAWMRCDALRAGDVVLTNGRMVGAANPNWKGGKALDKDGYVRVSCHRDHPRANRHGQVLEHHLVMEAHLGRLLADGEEVHHKNTIKNDNRLDNLELLTKAEHMRLHGGERGYLHMDGGTAGTGGAIRFVPVEDRVVSVVTDGEGHVYDIVCADPHRNFVANGIVVHNCGKTIQTLAAAPAGAPILVIGPAVAKGVWAREAAAWRPDLRASTISGRGKFRWPTVNEMLVINYDILPAVTVKTPRSPEAADECDRCGGRYADHSKGGIAGRCLVFAPKKEDTFTETPAAFLADCPAGLVVIVDEAHSCKNPKALRTLRVSAFTKAARESGGRNYLLTATPLLNSPPELWTVLKVAGLEKDAFGGNWGGFARGMGGVLDTITVQGGRQQKVWKWGGTPTPMIAGALKRVMLRRMKTDVLGQLPPKTRRQVDVELADKGLQRDMDEAWIELEDELDDVMEGKKSPSIPFDQISALRARIAKAKIPALLELVESYEDAEEPLVVFSAHRAPVEELAGRPGWAVILGGTSPDERTRIENAFQAGKLKGVACTIKAGGVAITLTRAAHEIFVDKEWTPALNAQAEDRCYRIGQDRPVLVTELVAAHPLDQQVAKLLGEKQALIGASVEKARMGAGEVKANAAQVAGAALAALDGQADKIRAAQLAAAERDATLAALLVRLAADDAAALAREAAEAVPLTREQRFERTVERAARKQRELDGASESRGPRTAVEAWAAGGIVYLATQDADFAQEENGVGFSKDCVGIGHALARIVCSKGGLTDRAWEVCVAVCIRFKGQIGAPPAVREEQAA
jgi:hypothetical protein